MFRIAIPVVAGETYTLDGTVAGLRFRGSTVMPVTFRLVQPSDTLSLATLDNTPVPPDSSLRIYRVDILSQGIVEANTVLTVAERASGIDKGLAVFDPADPTHLLLILRDGQLGPLQVEGLNRDASLWSSLLTLQSTLTEGTGSIGGIINLRFVIVP